MEDFDFYFLNNDKRVTLHPVFLVELRTPDFRKKQGFLSSLNGVLRILIKYMCVELGFSCFSS